MLGPTWSFVPLPGHHGTKQTFNCIEKVQMKMVNMISGLKSENYEGKLKEIGIESLSDRRKMADMIIVNKLVHGVGDLDYKQWFNIDPGRRPKRAGADPLNIQYRPCNLDLRRGFFSNRVINEWNNVPSDIKNLSVPGKFKAAYKKMRGATLTDNS
jgi:hypothetical protein